MRHDINITGYAFKLRPIELSDAQLIVDLRTSQPERSRFLHPISSDVNSSSVSGLTISDSASAKYILSFA